MKEISADVAVASRFFTSLSKMDVLNEPDKSLRHSMWREMNHCNVSLEYFYVVTFLF